MGLDLSARFAYSVGMAEPLWSGKDPLDEVRIKPKQRSPSSPQAPQVPQRAAAPAPPPVQSWSYPAPPAWGPPPGWTPVPRQRSTAVAVLLNCLWPGVGYFYAGGDESKAIVFTVLMGFAAVCSLTIIGLVVSVPLWFGCLLFTAIDVPGARAAQHAVARQPNPLAASEWRSCAGNRRTRAPARA